MKRFASSIVAASLLFAAATTSHAAAVLNTPAAPGALNGASIGRCIVLNTGKKPAEVTIEILNANGTVFATAMEPALAPGAGTTLSHTSLLLATYCRVTGLNAKSGRVTYVVVDGANNVLFSASAP